MEGAAKAGNCVGESAWLLTWSSSRAGRVLTGRQHDAAAAAVPVLEVLPKRRGAEAAVYRWSAALTESLEWLEAADETGLTRALSTKTFVDATVSRSCLGS